LEAVQLSIESGTICGQAHVQDIGWQRQVCAAGPDMQIGTIGQSLRMEAVSCSSRDGPP